MFSFYEPVPKYNKNCQGDGCDSDDDNEEEDDDDDDD